MTNLSHNYVPYLVFPIENNEDKCIIVFLHEILSTRNSISDMTRSNIKYLSIILND